MDATTTDGYVALANAINNMRLSVLITVSVVGLLGFAMWLYSRRQGSRERLAESTAKLRSEGKLTDVLVNLHGSVQKLDSGISGMSESQEASSNAIITSITRTGNLVRTLSQKVNGRMSVNDSARIVRDVFEKVAFREVCLLVERALRENDYDNRKPFVERKIKTQIGEALSEIRETLAGYPLGFDVRTYFPIDLASPGERFILCNDLWDRIEPLFRQHTMVEQRIEEAFLLIENTIRDSVSACYQKILAAEEKAGAGSKYSRDAFRTPLPAAAAGDSDVHPIVAGAEEFARPGVAAKTMLTRLGVRR